MADKESGAFVLRERAFQENTGRGPLSVLQANEYDFNKTTYPERGLGTEIPSYVIFYINLPMVSKYEKTENLVENAFSVSDQNVNRSRKGQYAIEDPILTGGTLAVQRGLGAVAAAGGRGNLQNAIPTNREQLGRTAAKGVQQAATGAAVAGLASTIEKKPKVQRIKEAIAIYMPDTVFHTYSHSYNEESLTEAMGEIGMAQRGVNSLSEGVSELSFNPLTGFGVPAAASTAYNAGGAEQLGKLAQTTGQVGGAFTSFALRSINKALNPQTELIYKSTGNRSFVYDFKFVPKTLRESQKIRDIIFLFRRYAAPDLAAEGDGGAYFIPPGQFDIQYYFKNEENKYIGRISTCVLENIDVNYSPLGQYSTFIDGAPVEVNLQLRFKEVDIITRDMVDAGF